MRAAPVRSRNAPQKTKTEGRNAQRAVRSHSHIGLSEPKRELLQSDQAKIDNAKLQLVYSRLTAPLTGRIGLRLVDLGNVVHATDQNGLAVITQLQPIAV